MKEILKEQLRKISLAKCDQFFLKNIPITKIELNLVEEINILSMSLKAGYTRSCYETFVKVGVLIQL